MDKVQLITYHLSLFMGLRKIKRALLSVSDKTGLVEFARELRGFGVELISTGGTARALREAGVEVRDISDVTGFPEMMDGRVKTLHPRIHGGLLALRDNAEHVEAMRANGIEPIDMVVVNLYPFEETIRRKDATLEEAVEQIDIGGPAMIRSAAKNYRDVAVVVSPKMYAEVIDEMKRNDGALSLKLRGRLAWRAFERTAMYDLAVQAYLIGQLSTEGEAPGSYSLSVLGVEENEEAFFSFMQKISAAESPEEALSIMTSNLPGEATAEEKDFPLVRELRLVKMAAPALRREPAPGRGPLRLPIGQHAVRRSPLGQGNVFQQLR